MSLTNGEEDSFGNVDWPVEPVWPIDIAPPWVTYKLADGSLVWGEYEWVSDLNFFEEVDEPVKLVKETWVCVGREEIVVGPAPSCPNCGETLPGKVEEGEPPTFCSEACWQEDIDRTLADRARDEAKFDEDEEARKRFESTQG